MKFECPKDAKGYRDCFHCPYADCVCNDKMDAREEAIYAEYHPNDIQIHHNRAEIRALEESCGRYFHKTGGKRGKAKKV
jgi:hypothetical protein